VRSGAEGTRTPDPLHAIERPTEPRSCESDREPVIKYGRMPVEGPDPSLFGRLLSSFSTVVPTPPQAGLLRPDCATRVLRPSGPTPRLRQSGEMSELVSRLSRLHTPACHLRPGQRASVVRTGQTSTLPRPWTPPWCERRAKQRRGHCGVGPQSRAAQSRSRPSPGRTVAVRRRGEASDAPARRRARSLASIFHRTVPRSPSTARPSVAAPSRTSRI
jgi:hypothetical protein